MAEAGEVAQATLIKRREETAATRSLLNTARLMDEDPTLLRLKELETLEKVTEKVDKSEIDSDHSLGTRPACSLSACGIRRVLHQRKLAKTSSHRLTNPGGIAVMDAGVDSRHRHFLHQVFDACPRADNAGRGCPRRGGDRRLDG